VFVSHDRAFVSALATRVVEVTPDGLRDFAGTYAEYLAKLGDDHLDGDAVALKAKAEKKTGPASAKSEGSWEDQKKKRNRAAQLPKLRDKVVSDLATAEARKAEIAAIYADPGFFQRASRKEIDALVTENDALAPKIETLMSEWEALETEIAAT